MNTHADKTSENKSQTVGNNLLKQQSNSESAFRFVDNRREAIAQRKLQEGINNNPRVQQLKAYQAMADNYTTQITQRKENKTGLPDNLKSGVESLSGMSMEHVKVHYNSSQPAQLNAYAYAQGNEIHVAPGKEQHLPHEAWHVVQQAQGRVKPTMQMKGGMSVNDDVGLEHEADVMGAKALGLGEVQRRNEGNVGMLGFTPSPPALQKKSGVVQAHGVIQRFDPLTIGLGLAALGGAAYGGYRYLRHWQRENAMNSIRAEQSGNPATATTFDHQALMDSPSLVRANNGTLPQHQRTYSININANNPVGHGRTGPEEMRIAEIHERTHISADQAYSANRDQSRLELFHEDPVNNGAEYRQTYTGIDNRTQRLREIAGNDKSLTSQQREEILSRIDYAEKPVEYDPVINELLAYSREYKIPANSGIVKALVILARENLARRQPGSPIMNQTSPI